MREPDSVLPSFPSLRIALPSVHPSCFDLLDHRCDNRRYPVTTVLPKYQDPLQECDEISLGLSRVWKRHDFVSGADGEIVTNFTDNTGIFEAGARSSGLILTVRHRPAA